MIITRLTTAFMLLYCALPVLADSEEAIATFPETETRMYNIGANKQLRKNPDKKIAALQNVIKQFPTVDAAPKAAMQIIHTELKRHNYEKVLTLSQSFLKTYPKYRSMCLNVETIVARLVTNKNVPETIRRRAFDTVALTCKGLGYLCAGWRNWMLPRKELSDKEKFETMLAAAKLAGYGDDPSGIAWTFAKNYLKNCSDNQQKIAVCEQYLRTFSPESLMYPQVRETLLSFQVASGDKSAKTTLKNLKKQRNVDRKAIARIFQKADDLLANKKYSQAIQVLKELKEKTLPKQLTINGWNKISKNLKNYPPEAVQDLLSVAIDTTHPRGINNNFLNYFADINYYATPELAAKTIALINKFFTTFQLSDIRVNHLMKHIQNRLKRELKGKERTQLWKCLSNITTRYEMMNVSSQLLFDIAVANLGDNPKKAADYLKRCVETGIHNKRTVQAKWLYELLTGKRSLIQPSSPRFLPERLTFQTAPVVSQPACTTNPPQMIADAKGSYTQRPNQVLLNTGKAVSNEVKNKTLAQAFDNSDKTAWIPKALPATMVIPLKQVGTLSEIIINSAYALEYTVVLLDKSGRKLRQFERFRLKIYAGNYYPTDYAVIPFTPCDQVAAIQISIYRRMGNQDGISEITVSGPKTFMRTMTLLPEQPLPDDKGSISLHYCIGEVTEKVTYPGKLFHYYRRQWFNPWRRDNIFKMHNLDFSAGIYGGRDLTLNFIHKGAVNWQLDDNKSGRVENRTKLKQQTLIPELSSNLHLINFYGSSLPVGNDKHGDGAMQFKSLAITGKATGYYLIRFKVSSWLPGWLGGDSGKWTSWYKGTDITIPDGAESYQLAAVLDSREVLAKTGATLGPVKITFQDKAAGKAKLYNVKEPGFIHDDIDGLVQYIKQNRPAIVFSKNGTKAEYEAAKALANKAGCYLISDDVEFNNRNEKGPIMAVGTPLINRYCRSLASRLLAWKNPEFLNSEKGFAMPPPKSLDHTSEFAFITGETPEAVLNALQRVMSQLSSFDADTNFNVFNVPLLERVYPWQLHQSADKLNSISLELGRNDRRSVKVGVTFNKQANDFRVSCSKLVNSQGKTIPSPTIRYTGYYEWAFFFGDVRLPDLLLDKPCLPIAKNTAFCIWLTMKTDKHTVPGVYKGTLTFTDGTSSKNVPFSVTVLPLTIPNKRITSYDYYSVPYWFEPGSDSYWQMFRKLTANQVEHGVNKIKISDPVHYKVINGKVVFNFDFVLKQMQKADDIFSKHAKGKPDFYFPAPTLHYEATMIYKANNKKMLNSLRTAYAAQLAETLKQNRYWKRTWLKIGDEPGSMEEWVKYARPYKKGGMKVWTTSGKKEMAEVTDAWCPVYCHNVHAPHLLEEKKLGKRPVWWYTCAGGGPGMWITSEMLHLLPIYWLTAKWGFEAVDNYAALSLSPAFGFPYRYTNGNAHRVIVTPAGAVIDTARREIEADGLYDCKLAFLIKDNITALRNAGQTEKADAAQKEFDAIMFSVVPYKWGYSMSPETWAEARHNLYKLALKVKEWGRD